MNTIAMHVISMRKEPRSGKSYTNMHMVTLPEYLQESMMVQEF
jgi:hypothetical protein